MKNLQAASRHAIGLILFAAYLAQSALACHEILGDPKTPQPEPDNRKFLLHLQLSKSGTVVAVRVLIGDGPLRKDAIREAARRRYHLRPGYNGAGVEVNFPRGKNSSPKIREAMVGGVSSCVPAGTAILVRLTHSSEADWLSQLLSGQPVVPTLDPQAKNGH